MSEQDIIQRFGVIFREIFDDENLLIGSETSAADIEAWDSLAHINLLVAIEAAFSVSFSLDELQTVKNVGEMVKLVARKVG